MVNLGQFGELKIQYFSTPKYYVGHKHIHSWANDYNPEIIDLFVDFGQVNDIALSW